MDTPNKLYVHRTPHLGLISGAEFDITGEDDVYFKKDALLAILNDKLEKAPNTSVTKTLQWMINQLETF
jgi:hypothetical protein